MGIAESSRWRWRSTYWLIFIITAIFVFLLLTWNSHSPRHGLRVGHHHDDGTLLGRPVLAEEQVSCRGPRGIELDISEDDNVKEHMLDGEVPQPYGGSYTELGLEHTWTDRESRYGPYGFGDGTSENMRSKVFWERIDWAHLQNKCLQRNLRPDLSPVDVPLISPQRRMTMPSWGDGGHWVGSLHTPPRRKRTSGRTAIVLRAYDSFKFQDEDFWTIRSLITETALQSGGRYAVFLLVDVADERYDVIRNKNDYETVLDSVPPEFRNMTVLFDQRNFLKAWYPKIVEWRPEFQIEQARQLFARFFPEFDHYWQMELDVRFTGNAGNMIDAIEEFARNEPRKQSRERSSFTFTPQTYNTYANFTSRVNEALDGGSAFWPGVKLPDIKPIGPYPPVLRPEDDRFEWGVGEPADLILLSATMNITLSTGWEKYHNWIFKFAQKEFTPRMSSAPCVSRASWNLLNAVHEAQVWEGKRLHSEATPASFALWHGLKISHPPFPVYGYFAKGNYSATAIDTYLNGGLPDPAHDAMAWGVAYGDQFAHETPIKSLEPTWSHMAAGSTHIYRVWLEGRAEVVAVTDADMQLPVVRGGRILLPNLMIHAVKTNGRPPKNPKIPE